MKLFLPFLILCMCIGGYACFNINQAKVSRLVLYRTLGDSLNWETVTFKKLENSPIKTFTDQETLQLVDRMTRIKKQYIWKGYTYGKLIYNTGDSAIIAISKYGGFFQNLKNKRLYSFDSEKDIRLWQGIINTSFKSAVY